MLCRKVVRNSFTVYGVELSNKRVHFFFCKHCSRVFSLYNLSALVQDFTFVLISALNENVADDFSDVFTDSHFLPRCQNLALDICLM